MVSQNLQRLRYDKAVTKKYAATFQGLGTFLRGYTLQVAQCVKDQSRGEETRTCIKDMLRELMQMINEFAVAESEDTKN